MLLVSTVITMLRSKTLHGLTELQAAIMAGAV